MRKSLLTAVAVCMLMPAVSQAQNSGTNVAVIDIKQVFDGHKRFKRMLDDIKGEIEKYDNEIRVKRQNLQKQAEGLRELKTSSIEYRQLESRIANEEADLKVEMSLKRRDILLREAEIYYDAYQEVVQHVSEFAGRYNIGLVLAFDSTKIDSSKRESVLKGVNRVVVYQRQLNITTNILERLNSGVPPRNANRQGGPSTPRNPNR